MNSATQQQATPPASPAAPTPTPAAARPPPPKVDLADGLFGEKHSGSESPIYHEKHTTYPPWIQGLGAMRAAVNLETKTKKPKPKSSTPSTPSAAVPARQRSVAFILFWGILFCISLYAASPMLVARAKHYGETGINIITDVFGLGEKVPASTTEIVETTTTNTVTGDAITTTSLTPDATGSASTTTLTISAVSDATDSTSTTTFTTL